jgi:hypothetical protein
VAAKGYFTLRREIPETGVPFIRINIDDFAYKTRKFTGYLLHPLNGKSVLVLQVHTSCRIAGRLSLNKRVDFFKTEALNNSHPGLEQQFITDQDQDQIYCSSPIFTARLL